MHMYIYIYSQFHTHQVDTANMYLYINVCLLTLIVLCKEENSQICPAILENSYSKKLHLKRSCLMFIKVNKTN